MLTLGTRCSRFWDSFVNYKELKTVGGFTVDTVMKLGFVFYFWDSCVKFDLFFYFLILYWLKIKFCILFAFFKIILLL